MKHRVIKAADLFCGAGGASEGLARACRGLGLGLKLVAINHWQRAVETHSLNHPDALHMCQSVESVDPRDVVPGGRLDILLAGPECTHHSSARGGRPINDQSRASAWHILRWLELLRVDHVIVENVPEFQTWGPIGANNQPLKRRKGETYRAFLTALRSLGYHVDTRVLNAADYGDPTTRCRLFIVARRGHKAVAWPMPTHSPDGGRSLFGATERWRAAREVIDWSIRSRSIFNRKRPLSPNTLARIESGLNRFGGRPFVLQQQAGGAPREVTEPIPTIATKGAIALVQPFLASYYGTENLRPVSEPIPTITTKDRFGLVETASDGDIRFRMLQPHELARAMSFGDDYQFAGNRSDKVKQIGNAWPTKLAEALCASQLQDYAAVKTSGWPMEATA